MKKRIIVDSNPLISALLGGKALSILLNKKFSFYTTENIIWEVKKYIPFVSQKTDVSEEELIFVLEKLPVDVIHPNIYDGQIIPAKKIIENRDIKDYSILALAMKFDIPIWSEDKDFENIGEINLLKTADILDLIERE